MRKGFSNLLNFMNKHLAKMTEQIVFKKYACAIGLSTEVQVTQTSDINDLRKISSRH